MAAPSPPKLGYLYNLINEGCPYIQVELNKTKLHYSYFTSIDYRRSSIYLKFCKYILGLSKQYVNITPRAELAQYPLDVFIKVQ